MLQKQLNMRHNKANALGRQKRRSFPALLLAAGDLRRSGERDQARPTGAPVTRIAQPPVDPTATSCDTLRASCREWRCPAATISFKKTLNRVVNGA